MSRRSLLQLSVGLFLICQPLRAIAIEYLAVEYSQNVVASLQNPFFEGEQVVDAFVEASSSSGQNFIFAHMARNDLGLVVDARSESFARYTLGAASGTASISQSVVLNGDFTPTVPGTVYGTAGNFPGDSVRIRLRVNAADGDVVFNAFSFSRFVTPAGSGVIGSGYGGIFIERNGQPYGDGTHLTPGDWVIVMSQRGNEAGPTSGSVAASAEFAAAWTLNNVFVGQTPTLYAKGITGQDEPSIDIAIEPPPASEPDTIAGVKLTFPTIGPLGVTDSFFVGLSTAVDAGPAKGALITGYEMNSEFSPITSLVVPTLPAGGENLTIKFGSQSVPVVAGQEINFGPTGIHEFAIAGFDPIAAGHATPHLVMGLQFAEEGLASLLGEGTLYIPPGDYNHDGFVEGRDLLAIQRGEAPNGGNDADLALWIQGFGEPLLPQSSTVPEPSAAVLIAAALLVMAGRFARRSATA